MKHEILREATREHSENFSVMSEQFVAVFLRARVFQPKADHPLGDFQAPRFFCGKRNVETEFMKNSFLVVEYSMNITQ